MNIVIHPATEVFSNKYAQNMKIEYTHSKPVGVQLCREGRYDMCIGSSDTIEKFPNLEIVQRFSPKMVWALYRPR